MAIKPPPIEVKEGAPEWIVTFADLMSLLLTFFVLLLSFSTTDEGKFNTMTGSIRTAFGMRSPIDVSDRPSGSNAVPRETPNQKKKKPQQKETLTIVKLREALEQAGLSDQGSVKVTEDGVVLELDGDLLFESGRTELKPEASAILDRLVEIASSTPGRLVVEGHTDDVPIATAAFPSNWELSGARAGSAVRYLTTGGVPSSRLTATGYADTKPLVPNTTKENRAKNRRVEFLFIKPKESS